MSYDQNSSGNNGNNNNNNNSGTQPPLSWYAAISSMALGALGRGTGRVPAVPAVPADRSNTSISADFITHSDNGESTAAATSTGAGIAGRPGSIPISFLINHTSEPHQSPRIPEYSSRPASSSSIPSPSLSPSAASFESASLIPAQIRRSPRTLSTPIIPLVGTSTPITLATMAETSASYYRTGARGSVQRLSQSYLHFSSQSGQSRDTNSNNSNIKDSTNNGGVHNDTIKDDNKDNNSDINIGSSSSSNSALPSPLMPAVTEKRIDAPVFSTVHHARPRPRYSASGKSRTFSHRSLPRSDIIVPNNLHARQVNTHRSVKGDRYNNGDNDNSNSNSNSSHNSINSINSINHDAAIVSQLRSSEAEKQKSLVNATQYIRSVSFPFEEDRPLEERRVSRSPSTAPSVKARALSAGKGAEGGDNYGHRAIKTEHEPQPSSIFSPVTPEFWGSPYSSTATSAIENSSSAGGSKARPKPKLTKTGKILQKPKKITAGNRKTAYTRFLQQQSKSLAERLPHLSAQERMKIIVEEWKVSDKNAHTTRRRSRVNPAQPPQTGGQSSRESQLSSSTSRAAALSGSSTDLTRRPSSTSNHEHVPSMSPSETRHRLLRSSNRNNSSTATSPLQDQKEEQEIPQPQQLCPDDVRDVEE
ncbi:hypothetical protein EMPS_06167 [Entomortierella parvispora]|uniref:Uncharacterized protein n=1 Tax=Entomortierella parvispora TaxID=205924 RepID=A0A9P3LX69_9FUNG|nr:hypothetical protein EMPS_06167 [Entomortierella parvispora]